MPCHSTAISFANQNQFEEFGLSVLNASRLLALMVAPTHDADDVYGNKYESFNSLTLCTYNKAFSFIRATAMSQSGIC